MAFLRTRCNSAFYYLIYRDPETGRRKEVAIKLRKDNEDDKAAAARLAQKYTKLEATGATTVTGDFKSWVVDYLTECYPNLNTRARMLHAWDALAVWLTKRKLYHPRMIRHSDVADFLKTRKKTAAHNTARLEAKLFAFILNEAMRREYCEKNHFALVKIRREAAKQKPELRDADFLAARKAFAAGSQRHEGNGYAPWMAVVFEIMLFLGCRFCEACIPMENIDFKNDLLHMRDSKRKDDDPRKFFTVPIPAGLRPTLWKLRHEAATTPPLTREMNHRFNKVLKRICGTTSHALRVSFVTRCHRSGLSEREAMNLVNHASRITHSIYSRLNVEDKQRSLARVQQPPAPPVEG